MNFEQRLKLLKVYESEQKEKRRASYNSGYEISDCESFSALITRVKKYELSLKEYNDFFERQEGCCAICQIHQSDLNKSLCIDYDHKTGFVRGLICSNCNLGLGLFKDSHRIINQAERYLRLSRYKQNLQKEKLITTKKINDLQPSLFDED